MRYVFKGLYLTWGVKCKKKIKGEKKIDAGLAIYETHEFNKL